MKYLSFLLQSIASAFSKALKNNMQLYIPEVFCLIQKPYVVFEWSGVEWHCIIEQRHSTPKHPFMYNHGSKCSNNNKHVDQSLELGLGQLDLLVMSLS